MNKQELSSACRCDVVSADRFVWGRTKSHRSPGRKSGQVASTKFGAGRSRTDAIWKQLKPTSSSWGSNQVASMCGVK